MNDKLTFTNWHTVRTTHTPTQHSTPSQGATSESVDMGRSIYVFSWVYSIFAFCFICPPKAFVDAKVTVAGILGARLGNEVGVNE